VLDVAVAVTCLTCPTKSNTQMAGKPPIEVKAQLADVSLIFVLGSRTIVGSAYTNACVEITGIGIGIVSEDRIRVGEVKGATVLRVVIDRVAVLLI
jgi:hypothetical protein